MIRGMRARREVAGDAATPSPSAWGDDPAVEPDREQIKVPAVRLAKVGSARGASKRRTR